MQSIQTHIIKEMYYHINLCIRVSHVADDAAILHAVKLFSGNNILVAWIRKITEFLILRWKLWFLPQTPLLDYLNKTRICVLQIWWLSKQK